MRRYRLYRIAMLTAAFCTLHAPAGGQGLAGSVTGLVLDASGGVVAGAEVTLTHSATRTGLQTRTNHNGVYSFPAAPIGEFQIQVAAAGFKTHAGEGIVVEVARVTRYDVALEVGSVEEKVTVSAEGSPLQLETSSGGTQVRKGMLDALPFQLSGSTRDVTSFVRLAPGASGGSFGVNLTGGRGFASEVLVDGVPIAYRGDISAPDRARPAYATVAEFQVITAVPPAEFGRTSSGVVVFASRAGGNRVNADLQLLLRSNAFDARRFNARIADPTRQGEFAASVGGPVFLPKLYDGRDRTFFYANYTGFRRYNEILGQVRTVGTARMRQGDFSLNPQTIFDPLTGGAGAARTPFAGNRIPGARISRLAAAVNAIVPEENVSRLESNLLEGTKQIEDADNYFYRLDHNFSPRHRLTSTGRLNHHSRSETGTAFPISSAYDDPHFHPHSYMAAYDWILKPNLLNRFQFGFSRWKTDFSITPAIPYQVPGSFGPGFPEVRFASQGLTAIGGNNDRLLRSKGFDFQNSLSWTRNRHNVKAGFRLDRFHFDTNIIGRRNGSYTFSSVATSQPGVANSGHAYASYLLGAPNSAAMAFLLPTELRSHYFGLYVQDDWKVTRRLTLNYGFRWEFQTPWYETQGRLSIMDPTLANPRAGGIPGALRFGGDGPGRTGERRFVATNFGNPGPRLGLAYQAGPNTVLRLGGGFFYSPLVFSFVSTQGFQSDVTLSSPDGGLTPAFYTEQGWPSAVVRLPPLIDPSFANGGSTFFTENEPGGSGRLARTAQWQFGVQHKLAGFVLDGSYVGTKANGIPTQSLVNLNQVNPERLALGALLTRNINDPAVQAQGFRVPYAGFNGTLAQALRPFPQYQTITTYEPPAGNSIYHAFLFRAERRLAAGLQGLVSYAWSKLLTDSDMTLQGSLGGAPAGRRPLLQNNFDRRAERSVASSDLPHRLVLSYSYELPLGRGKKLFHQGLAAHILGGFGVAAIHTYESGYPLAITIPNNLPVFNGSRRPNRVAGVAPVTGPGHGAFRPLNLLSGERGDIQLERNAFAVPPSFAFGDSAPWLADVRAFGQRNEDLALIKRQAIGEARFVEFRADFFNAFNRRNLLFPVTDLTSQDFGRIREQRAARIIQLGLRTVF